MGRRVSERAGGRAGGLENGRGTPELTIHSPDPPQPACKPCPAHPNPCSPTLHHPIPPWHPTRSQASDSIRPTACLAPACLPSSGPSSLVPRPRQPAWGWLQSSGWLKRARLAQPRGKLPPQARASTWNRIRVQRIRAPPRTTTLPRRAVGRRAAAIRAMAVAMVVTLSTGTAGGWAGRGSCWGVAEAPTPLCTQRPAPLPHRRLGSRGSMVGCEEEVGGCNRVGRGQEEQEQQQQQQEQEQEQL